MAVKRPNIERLLELLGRLGELAATASELERISRDPYTRAYQSGQQFVLAMVCMELRRILGSKAESIEAAAERPKAKAAPLASPGY